MTIFFSRTQTFLLQGLYQFSSRTQTFLLQGQDPNITASRSGPKHSCFKVFINFPLGSKHSCFKVFINFSLGPKHSCFKVFINMLQGQIQMQTLSNSGPNKLWKLHLYPFKFKSISATNFFNRSLHFLWLGTVWSQQQTVTLVLHKFHDGNADFYFCGLLVQFDTNTFHCLYQGFVCVLFQFGML